MLDKNLVQRLFGGAIYGFVIIICTTPIGELYLGKVFPFLKQFHLFYALIAFFLIVGLWECLKMMKFSNSWEKYALYPLALIVFYRFSKKYFDHGFYYQFNVSELLGVSLIVIAIITLFKFSKELYYDNGKLIFSVIYLALPFSFALALPSYSEINPDKLFTLEIFFLFILIWSSDSFAYFTGRLFGKHKMAPKISPKKTWEGFAGGVVLTLLLGFVVESYQPDLRGNWAVIGFLVAIFAPLGDLVESQLKRTFGVKDSGNIIPGHGGILDRLDSFIICVPVVYLYFILEKLV